MKEGLKSNSTVDPFLFHGRLVSTVDLGLVLYCLGCNSGLILVTGVFILALTSKLASDLFFLLAINGLSGNFLRGCCRLRLFPSSLK